MFAEPPEVKKELWGGKFWSDGYFVASIRKSKSEDVVREYIKSQGKQAEYEQLMLKFQSRKANTPAPTKFAGGKRTVDI